MKIHPSNTNSPRTVKKRLGETFSAFRKRVRPVSDAFVNLKKRSNAKLTKSTENLARGFNFNFRRGGNRTEYSSNFEATIDSCTKEDIQGQIDRIEREEHALREMHDLYRYIPKTSLQHSYSQYHMNWPNHDGD